jgi:hypothetical protein
VAHGRTRDDITWDGVVRAGRILFGARAEALLGGAAWRKELKRAYKRRALETHPDRARSLGRPEAELAREFALVVEAYQLLIEAPDLPPPPARRGGPAQRRRESPPPAPAAPRPEARGRQHRHEPRPRPEPRQAAGARAARGATRPAAPLPARRMRLGEFLYYSRHIPFEALIEAIAWQRQQRPRVGHIAVECGYLTHDQVLDVLELRRRAGALDVPFAEYAARIGMLTPFARPAVLARQGKLQRRIGRFFVERGWLTERELALARAEVARHNAKLGER